MWHQNAKSIYVHVNCVLTYLIGTNEEYFCFEHLHSTRGRGLAELAVQLTPSSRETTETIRQ